MKAQTELKKREADARASLRRKKPDCSGAIHALASDAKAKPSESLPIPAPLLLRVPDVMATLNMGRTAVYGLFQSGALPSVRIGKCRFVKTQDLDGFLASLSTGPLESRMR